MQKTNNTRYIKLNDGNEMPAIGLGTYKITNEKKAIVQAIVEAGYRLIDTASKYENEEMIGEAIQEAMEMTGIKREEMFVTTKIWFEEYENPENALRESLKRLKLDYVNLYLIHWPIGFFALPKKPLHLLWKELELLVDKGLTKSIGVSNVNMQLMLDLLCYARIKPAVN